MNEALNNAIIAKYPKMFTKHKNFGFPEISCNDGWYNIIEQLCRQIDWYLSEPANFTNKSTPAQVVVSQVKEKFGGLRFYYAGGDDYIYGLVAMAEGIASCTCETCGAPGKLLRTGWIRVLCETHTPTIEEDEDY